MDTCRSLGPAVMLANPADRELVIFAMILETGPQVRARVACGWSRSGSSPAPAVIDAKMRAVAGVKS